MCESCLPQFDRRQLLKGLFAGTVAVVGGLGAGSIAEAAVPVMPGLSIRPRSAWAGDSRQPTGQLNREDVRFLLVHHTATPIGLDPISVMRVAYDLHTGPEKGWPDVAYNFFIDQFGVVWEARAGSLAGPVEASATGGSQGFAQLVCLLGDFTSVLPTAEALASLNLTLAWLADRDNVDTTPGATVTFTSRGSNRWAAGDTVTAATISGHRDMSQTACPGDTFYPHLVSRVASEVTALRGGATAPATSTPTLTTTTTTTTASPTTSTTPTTTTQVATTTTTTEVTTTTGVPATPPPDDEQIAAAAPPSPRGTPQASPSSAADDGGGWSTGTLVGLGAAAVATGAVLYSARHALADGEDEELEAPM